MTKSPSAQISDLTLAANEIAVPSVHVARIAQYLQEVSDAVKGDNCRIIADVGQVEEGIYVICAHYPGLLKVWTYKPDDAEGFVEKNSYLLHKNGLTIIGDKMEFWTRMRSGTFEVQQAKIYENGVLRSVDVSKDASMGVDDLPRVVAFDSRNGTALLRVCQAATILTLATSFLMFLRPPGFIPDEGPWGFIARMYCMLVPLILYGVFRFALASWNLKHLTSRPTVKNGFVIDGDTLNQPGLFSRKSKPFKSLDMEDDPRFSPRLHEGVLKLPSQIHALFDNGQYGLISAKELAARLP